MASSVLSVDSVPLVDVEGRRAELFPVDFGGGVRGRWMRFGALDELWLSHIGPDGRVHTGAVSKREFIVLSEEPASVVGTLRCADCDWEGHLTSGQWSAL